MVGNKAKAATERSTGAERGLSALSWHVVASHVDPVAANRAIAGRWCHEPR